MNEKTLFYLSVLAALVGLGFLLIYAEELDLKVIESLDTAKIEEQVKLKGAISKLTVKDKVLFIEMQGEKVETINVILFTDEDIFLKEGDYIEVYGTVEEYKGKNEVISNKIIIK